MTVLDETYIARQVTKRYGISFDGDKDEYDGEVFFVIRPRDLQKPNGFAITLSKTTRVLEAGFRADNFSGSLLRTMGEAETLKITAFTSAIEKIKSIYSIELNVNGNTYENAPDCFSGDLWSNFELVCDGRLSSNAKTDQALLNEKASDLVIDVLGAILTLLEIQEASDSFPLHESGLPEGAKLLVEVNKYERNPINRANCIKHYGDTCQVCKFSFANTYGDIGDEFIEVHHIIPVSMMSADYIVDPVKDLIPLCSNCHSMIHRKDPPFSIEVLKALFENPDQKTDGIVTRISIADVSYE